MNIREFSDRVLAAAKAAGIDPAEISYSESASFSAQARLGKLEDYQVSDRISFVLRGAVGGRIGTASTQAIDEDSIALLVRGVTESAELIETDEQDDILPPDEHYETVVNWKPELESVTAGEKIERVMALDRCVCRADSRITPEHSVVSSGSETFCLRNSLGLDLSHSSNMIYAYTSVMAREDGHTATGGKLLWGYGLEDVDAQTLAQSAVSDALSKLNAGRMKSGVYPVVIRNSAMGDLLATFSGVFSADNAQKGLSLLAGKEGTAIASPAVTLVDDPLMPWGMGSCPFDREGAATMTKNVIDGGVLRTLLHNRKTARKAGVQTTGNAAGAGTVAPSNLYIAPGQAPLDDLLARMGDGLLITEVSGLHAGANPISGDFSLLSRGFEIANGQIQRAVEQFTVAGNFFTLLQEIEGVGSDLLFEGSPIGSPSVAVKALHIAGE